MLFVNFHHRLDAVLRIRLCKIPVEIILPKDARITFVREDERIRQELVIDDRTIADNVVILHERDSLFGPAPHQDSGGSQSSHAGSVAVAQIAETPAQRKIKRAYRVVRPGVRFIEPIVDGAFAVPTFTDGIWLEARAVA